MFFSLTFLLLFIAATNSRPNLYFTNETTRANELNETLPLFLTGDSSNVAIQYGNDVQLTGPGTVDLILMDQNLDVDIDLNKCSDRVKFCYSSLEKNSEASALCENDFCGFEVDGRSNTEIDLPGQKGLKTKFLDKKCEPIRMQEIKTKYCGLAAESCKPLIGEEDKRITIIVEKASSCPTFIKNARIYYPPTTTTTSTSLPSIKSVAPSETSNASSEWYIWIIIGVLLVLLIGIIIAIFVCWKKQICLFKKKTEAKKRITITDTVETGIITKAEDIPEPKFESKPETKPKTKITEEIAPPPPKAAKKSKKKPKKSKKEKQKTPAKKDTADDPIPPETPVVDAAADHGTPSMEPDSVAPLPPPPPPQMNFSVHPLQSLTQQQVLDGDYYTPKKMRSIKSGSSKSGASNRKSTGPHPIVIKMKLEPHYSSLRRWKYTAMEHGKWKEFEQHYKVDPTKKPLDVEVSLLSGYIGDIFVIINRLIEESQATLKEKGAKFLGNGKAAKKFPASVYEYLEDPETPEYIRYTAMGSEIGNGVFLDETEFQNYSLSALLLIGFTTSIPDKKRRHALAVFRRQLPKRRRQISVEERERYGFPANAIELAFKRDPRLFGNVEGMKTDSTKNLSEVTED